MAILTDTEITSLLATYRRLEREAHGDGDWWRLARHVVEFALGTAMRRGEIIGLRWRSIERLDAAARPRDDRAREDRDAEEPISRRTMELGPRTAGRPRRGLEGEPYRSDDSLVFGHPPRDPGRPDEALSRLYAAGAEGGRGSRSRSGHGMTSGIPR